MNRTTCFLIIVCLTGGGIIGMPLSVNGERGLAVDGVSITDQHGKEVVLYQESYALVIGISNYTHGWPKLPGVRRDVEEVKTALAEHGFHVVVNMDLDANALEQAFKDFINQYGHHPESRLLFYFAGHGQTLELAYGGEMGYIVPADAPLPDENEQGFLAKAMAMQMIEVYARSIQSKHALFLFDSCFSGSLFAISRAVPEHITHKTAYPVRYFITSGSANEQVPDESIFRHQFIAALKGDGDINNDGYVTGTELGSFLENTVINYSKGTQHPQYGKIRDPNLDKGDFVFQISVTISVEASPETKPAPAQEIDPETAMWKLIELSENISDVQDFLAAFPEGKFAKVAQLKLKQLERQQHQETAAPVSPTPLSTAGAEAEQTITELLKQADAYFERQWYTTPENTNAFDLYQDVLKLDPDNAHAQQQIEKIAQFYKSRAEREEQQGQTAQAIQYYRKYLTIIPVDEAVLTKITALEGHIAPLVLDQATWDNGHWQ